MGPLLVCLVICAAVAAATWIASLVTREYSWVDRIWSVVPVVYVWVFAGRERVRRAPRAHGRARDRSGASGSPSTSRARAATARAARTTAGRCCAGGWRPWQYQLFNLFFISIYQNALILLFCLPALTVYEAGPTPLGAWDVVLAVVFLAFLVGETIADQQQWAFHRWKAAERAAGRDPQPGFLQAGLFRVSRHPNFFFEQAQWWVFYGFAVAATGVWLHWTIAGAVLLTLLFIGSTIFTESISRAKYPDYDDYRARTSAIVPWFPRSHAAAGERTA